MNDTILSPCTPGDIPDLITIATTAYKQHYTHLWHDKGEAYMASIFSERSIFEEMRNTDTAFYMIYVQGQLSGFLKLQSNAPLDGYDASDCLELERLYLVKDATGKGVGQQVLDFVRQQARHKQQGVVWLKAMASNSDVLRFYRKAGFEPCGTLMFDKPHLKDAYKDMHLLKLELQTPEKKSTLPTKSSRKASKKELCFE